MTNQKKILESLKQESEKRINLFFSYVKAKYFDQDQQDRITGEDITTYDLCKQTCKTHLQFPPFMMSHMDQKVSTSLLPVSPLSISKRAQKYIVSSLVFSCIVSSRAFSALADNET